MRRGQPHLVIDGPPAVEPDPHVRRTTMDEFDVVYPACVDFYTEELGISPEYGGGGSFYRARVQQLISRGWQFARIEDGRVVFKAEVGCVSPYAAQIQGVYVDPDRRGEGLGSRGMAAVVEAIRHEIAPVASLYVNELEPAGPAGLREGRLHRDRAASPRSCSDAVRSPRMPRAGPPLRRAAQWSLGPRSSRLVALSTWSGPRSSSR